MSRPEYRVADITATLTWHSTAYRLPPIGRPVWTSDGGTIYMAVRTHGHYYADVCAGPYNAGDGWEMVKTDDDTWDSVGWWAALPAPLSKADMSHSVSAETAVDAAKRARRR